MSKVLIMGWFASERRTKEFLFNLVLLAVVLISWGYVIAAGRFVSERYLGRIDLTQFQDERERRAPQFWQREE